ncbi:MAG: sulfatase-like hydrolase/transferase [Akkermansiaceae bacterium]|nr:sulfatase-like hydrolase/transferase [Akkermansiaceae bacterium]
MKERITFFCTLLLVNSSFAMAPNIVIIVTDDQGWGDVGYHTAAGQVPIQTPNMDGFLAKGIRLEKFYATPVCSITRSCLLTGRNTIRTATGNNRGLDLSEHIMPQTFKAAGYQTYMCGKWHLGGWANNTNTTTLNGTTFAVKQEGDAYLPHNRGWDIHYGQYGGAINYFTHRTSDPGLNNAVDWWLNGATQNETTDLQGNGGHSTDLLADKAVSLIQNRDPSKPILLYLAFNAVHAGVSAPTAYITKYQNLGVTNLARRTLSAAVDCMDVAMGRVLAALDTAGIANNTVVFFMSDNGGNEPTGSINDPLRGTKNQDSYDGGNIHTLAAIRWPGVLATNVISNQYVWVGDIFPTLCAATAVTALGTKPFDGLNLWPALLSINSGNPNGPQRPSTLVTSVTKPAALNTFTDPVLGGSKMFKLIRTKGTPASNELFNMTDDPYETTDLAANAVYATIITTLTTPITSITPENYPPNFGEAPKTQSVQQGGSITLYAPFTSYGKIPSVQWRKNTTPINGATSYYQIANAGVNVNGVFMATLTLNNLNSTNTANYTVIASSANGSTTSTAGTLTIIKPFSTQNDGLPDSWKIANGIDPSISSAINGPLGDIDKDGRNNLLEYAFNTNPQLHEKDPVRGASVTKAGDGLKYFEISYPRRIGAIDLMDTVEMSNDITTWPSPGVTSETVSIVANPDGITETVTVRVLPTLASNARMFVRVRVTSQ